MAEKLGCDIPTIKAVFEVEAAGKFYNTNGSQVRRFEPHHFPKQHWGRLGFAPKKGQAPWRASLKVSTSRRRQMYDIAQTINPELAARAASWGAPQIMGFNHELAGYSSALQMVDAFEQGADEQIRAFVAFVISNNLDTHLRSQDWYSFARGYNGTGQATKYAGLIESAYRRQSGGQSSSPVLRVGSRGQAVAEMQLQLQGLGYKLEADGAFGQGTRRVVREFQAEHGLQVDGLAGAATLKRIETESGEAMHIDRQEQPKTSVDNLVDKVTSVGPAVVGSGGLAGVLGSVNEQSQTLLVGGLVVGVIVLGAIWLLKKKG